MDDELVDVPAAIEGWRVEACISRLEGDREWAALFDRAADLFDAILSYNQQS